MAMNLRFARMLGWYSLLHYQPERDVQPCAYLNIPLGNVGKPLAKSAKTPSCGNSTLNYKGGCGSCKYKKICGVVS